MVSKTWHRAFLTPSKRAELENTGLVEMREILPEEKVILSGVALKDADHLIVETDSSYSPINSPNIKWIELCEQLYEVSCANNVECADTLSQNKHIVTISPSKMNKVVNRFSGGRLQGSKTPSTVSGKYMSQKPLLATGINGDGEIITIVDSGLDMKSNYFYDPTHPDFQYDQLQNDQRKVLIYNSTFGDKADGIGHGTHVNGIAAGKSVCTNCNPELYDGMAPSAKIIFYDAAKGNTPQLLPVSMPDIITKMKEYGSNIVSGSWGTFPQNRLNSYAYDVLFYGNPDILGVFAAGNEGTTEVNNQQLQQLFSINSPGSSKNVFSVGNMLSPDTISLETDPDADIERGSEATFKINNVIVFVAAWSKSPMRIGLDPTIIGSLVTPSSTASDKIVYIDSNHCSALSSLTSAPKAVLFGKSGQQKCSAVEFPVVYTTNDLSSLLNTEVTISPTILPIPESMDISSSIGPTVTGIMKPDISAVGDLVISAKATTSTTPHDDLIGMAGTSMATPLISGTAALVDQYFKKKLITPGSSLLKALLIASTDPIQPGTRSPDAFSGQGLPNLQNILSDSTNTVQNVLIADKDHLFATITVTGTTEPLRIALSYLDYQLNPESFVNFFAELRLFVKDPNGKVYYGNMYPNDMEEHFSNNLKIVIENDKLVTGNYEIHVINQQISLRNAGNVQIKFSACAAGPINAGTLSFSKVTTCGTCNNQGTCDENNICKCQKGYLGSNCQIKEYDLNEQDAVVDVPPSGLIYFKMTLPENYTKTFVSVKKESYPGFSNGFILYYAFNETFVIGNNANLSPLDKNTNYMSINLLVQQSDIPGGTTIHFTGFNNFPYSNKITAHSGIGEEYPDNNVDPTTKNPNSLNSGQIAGIVIGCVVAVALVVGLVIFLRKRRNMCVEAADVDP